MQRAAQRGVVAEFGIAEHRRDGEAGRPDLTQQRERQPPFLLEAHVAGIRARCRASGVSHTQIYIDENNNLVLENYGIQPLRLNEIKPLK